MTTHKIRVAFWHNTFAPYRVPLFQRLSAFEDIDLTVYYGSAKDAYRKWDVIFGDYYKYVLLPYVSIPGYPHKFNYTLFRELTIHRYDVIIGVENELGGQIAFWSARWMHVPFIIWSDQINYRIIRDKKEYTAISCLQKALPFVGRMLHQSIFFPFLQGAIYIKRHADACLAAGIKTCEHLLSVGCRAPIFRYGCTIDTHTFLKKIQEQENVIMKQRLGIERRCVILSVSYLQKRKGVQYLIEAFLQLHDPNLVLVIVGDGDYKAELLKLVPEGRTDILFVGHDEDTAKYYAMADMFVMPSFSDPWGLTVNEAMLAGLPVITTTNVGAQELIQGNGFVIPPRDAAALKNALERLINDAPLRLEMGKRSREIIKDYTIEHSAEVCRQAIHAVAKPLIDDRGK